MKLIHCADIHLGSSLNSVLPPDKAETRKAELRRAFANMLDYGRAVGVRAVLLCGDVFDSDRPFKKDKEFFYNAVKSHADTDFYYLRGNHDTSASYIEELPNLKTFTPDGWTTYDLGEGFTVSGIEMTGKNVASLYASLSLPEGKTNIVMLHGAPGSSVGKDLVCLNKLKQKHISYLALGHIHKRAEGEIERGVPYVMPGCLEGRGFDEDGEKGFYLMDTDGGKVSYRFVENSQRVVRIREIDISAAKDLFSATEIVRGSVKCERSDIVRVVLTGETDFECDGMEKDAKAALSGMCWYVDVKDKTRPKLDLTAAEGDLSLRGEFMRLVSGSDMDDDMKRAVLVAGIRALSGREADV